MTVPILWMRAALLGLGESFTAAERQTRAVRSQTDSVLDISRLRQ